MWQVDRSRAPWWLRGATADALGAPGPLAASGRLRARGARPPRRRRSRARPRRRAGGLAAACSCSTASKGAPTPCTRKGWRSVGAGRLALHGAQLSLLRPRSARPHAPAQEPARRASTIRARPPTSTSRCARWPRASRRCRSTPSGFRWGETCCSSGWVSGRGASTIRGAATISRPLRPGGGLSLSGTAGRRAFTPTHFLRRLKPKALDVLARFPARDGAPRRRRASARARTFAEFDELRHGADARVRQRRGLLPAFELARISARASRVPTLCIAAEDDPFYPPRRWSGRARPARRRSASRSPPWGGHTGFVAGPWPWRPRYWAEERVVDWLGESRQGPDRAIIVCDAASSARTVTALSPWSGCRNGDGAVANTCCPKQRRITRCRAGRPRRIADLDLVSGRSPASSMWRSGSSGRASALQRERDLGPERRDSGGAS